MTLLIPSKHVKFRPLLFVMLMIALSGYKLGAQSFSITGEHTCATAGVSYTYTIAGPWTASTAMTWTINGGVITGTSNSSVSGTPMPSISVTWNAGVSSGSVTVSTSSPTGNASITTGITPVMNAGSFTGGTNQNLAYNAIPSTITCSPAIGGGCAPTYQYMWESSTDGVTWARSAYDIQCVLRNHAGI